MSSRSALSIAPNSSMKLGGLLDRPCPIERRTERVQVPVRQHSDCNDFGIGHNRLARVSPTNYPPRRPAAKGKSKQAAHANRSGAVGGARASDALTRGVRSVYIASSSLSICRATFFLNTWKPPVDALLPPRLAGVRTRPCQVLEFPPAAKRNQTSARKRLPRL